MDRNTIINIIGKEFYTTNIEGGEWSYVQDAGSKAALEKALGRPFEHFKLDIRFEKSDTVVLVETKQSFTKADRKQLAEYVDEEKALHPTNKIIAILANTKNNKIEVFRTFIDDAYLLKDEIVLDSIEHYIKLFEVNKQNDREKVLKNTYNLNELLHKLDINEDKRSQFVGTTLLYIKDMVRKLGKNSIDKALADDLEKIWRVMDAKQIRAGIESVLTNLLDGSENKEAKIRLLQKNVLNDQKVKKLTITNWIKVMKTILLDIYKYIDIDSSEGQDILNLFFIAFNKYTGKADKNQAFTPDHITDFMCRVTNVDRNKIVLDPTCGSGSFLVQAMVKELSDCRKGKTEDETKVLMKKVREKHIYGIELEEMAYGLSTTNMLIHGDGNSNIKLGNCFEEKEFIKKANPDIILMNPPYNAKPINIPNIYKTTWGKPKKKQDDSTAEKKEDPTKGLVFIHYLSDVVQEMNNELEKEGKPSKTVKLAVLLPVSAAIGTSTIIEAEKEYMLKNNTLEAVFSLPNEIFYPGASVNACCMVFTLGKPHINADGTINETFFGYYREDGFKKKKNLGRVEQFDKDNNSLWKTIEEEWLSLYRNKRIVDGKSAMSIVTGKDEWLCEAYMKTDYSKLTESDFQQTLNNYLAYLVKEGKVYEA